jgi:mono/diheme cytochrome c family protein
MLGAFLLVMLMQQSPTVLDGAYSDAQVARGKIAYTTNCSSCHGNAFEGVSAPTLAGERFIERWREGTLDGLYDFIRERMPFGQPAGSKRISDAEYLDILTYVLKGNGYPSGPAELTRQNAAQVMLVGKNGHQPVPDGSLVVTVGCLNQHDGRWILSNATEPARTRNDATSTPAELTASGAKNLGKLTFRLADLDAAPGFTPETHLGHKMQIKGFLVRQPDAERINLSSAEMLDSTCPPAQ